MFYLGAPKSWYRGLRWKTALASFAAVSIGGVSIAAACGLNPAALPASATCLATTTSVPGSTSTTVAPEPVSQVVLNDTALQAKAKLFISPAVFAPTTGNLVLAIPVNNRSYRSSGTNDSTSNDSVSTPVPVGDTTSDPISSALSFLNGAGIDLTSIFDAISAFGISPDSLISAAAGGSGSSSGSNNLDSVTSAIASLAGGALGGFGTSGSASSTPATTGTDDPAVILGALSSAGVNLGTLLSALQAQGLNPMSLQTVLTPGGAANLDPATVAKIQAAVLQATGGNDAKLIAALQSANVDPAIVSVLTNAGGSSSGTTVVSPGKVTPSTPNSTSTATGGTTTAATGTQDPAVILGALSSAGINLGTLLGDLQAQGLDPMSLETILTPGEAAKLDPATVAKIQAAVLQAAGGSDARLIAALQAANVDPAIVGVLTRSSDPTPGTSPTTTPAPVPTTIAPEPTTAVPPATTVPLSTESTLPPAQGTDDPAVILGALSSAGVNLGTLMTDLQAQGLDPMSLETILTPGEAAKLDPATVAKIQAAVLQATGGSDANLIDQLQSANVDPAIVAVLTSNSGTTSDSTQTTTTTTPGTMCANTKAHKSHDAKSHKSDDAKRKSEGHDKGPTGSHSSTSTTVAPVTSTDSSGTTVTRSFSFNVSPQIVAAVLQLLSALNINVNDLAGGTASLGLG